MNWDVLDRGTAEDALNYFMEILWLMLAKHIPRRIIHNMKSSHSWLTVRSREAIGKKNAAEGTDSFAQECLRCQGILLEERSKYVERLKIKLSTLPRQSKQWWRINRELLNRKVNLSPMLIL